MADHKSTITTGIIGNHHVETPANASPTIATKHKQTIIV
jgi:hypothetical protein